MTDLPNPAAPLARARASLIPKLYTTLTTGYGWGPFRTDLLAGLTVAIVALPLAMALAIASGATPDKGLITVVVAGFLISALGGSRVQIGGPTGAFVVVVFNVIQQHGYDGLILATLMAGVILAVAGWTRLGGYIRYVPEPVVTGFTAGIAVIIFSSQVRDLLGLSMTGVPADFFDKWTAFWAARDSLTPWAVGLSAGSLLAIVLLRRFAPRLPGFLIVVAGTSVLAALAHLPVETIGSRFGELSAALPVPHLPTISLARLQELAPSALTIAFLAGVESLLSAVVADGMIGTRHRSNAELVAQGAANFASALFGGLPATGAIARTATNVRAGGRSPVAGMAHAGFVLVFMLLAGHWMTFVPLASLAAILVLVAWNMSEIPRFRRLLRAPMGDRVVLLASFLLTVTVDLTVAIAVGVVLAAVVFMHRMAELAGVEQGVSLGGEEEEDDHVLAEQAGETRTYRLRGPLFFGAASGLSELLTGLLASGSELPKTFRLDMTDVPLVDASGVGVLREFTERCAKHGVAVRLDNVQAQPARVLKAMGVEV
jgi:SulP family sulfate permease